MEIRIDIEESGTRVILVGEVGEKDVEHIQRALQILLRRGYDRLILDLRKVPAINAGVLGLLAGNLEHAGFGENRLAITGLNEGLKRLFESMGVDSMFDISQPVVTDVARLGPAASMSRNEAAV